MNETDKFMNEMRKEAKNNMKDQLKLSPSQLRECIQRGNDIERLFVLKGEAILKNSVKADGKETNRKLNEVALHIQASEVRAISLLATVAKIIVRNNTDEVLQKLLDDVTEERVEQILNDIDNFAGDLMKGLNLDDLSGFSSDMN